MAKEKTIITVSTARELFGKHGIDVFPRLLGGQEWFKAIGRAHTMRLEWKQRKFAARLGREVTLHEAADDHESLEYLSETQPVWIQLGGMLNYIVLKDGRETLLSDLWFDETECFNEDRKFGIVHLDGWKNAIGLDGQLRSVCWFDRVDPWLVDEEFVDFVVNINGWEYCVMRDGQEGIVPLSDWVLDERCKVFPKRNIGDVVRYKMEDGPEVAYKVMQAVSDSWAGTVNGAYDNCRDCDCSSCDSQYYVPTKQFKRMMGSCLKLYNGSGHNVVFKCVGNTIID